MQCPIDRAQHTMAFDNSVMGTLRGRLVEPRQRLDSRAQSADCKARMLPRRHWDVPTEQEVFGLAT